MQLTYHLLAFLTFAIRHHLVKAYVSQWYFLQIVIICIIFELKAMK